MHILHGEVSISKATHLVVLCTHTSIYSKSRNLGLSCSRNLGLFCIALASGLLRGTDGQVTVGEGPSTPMEFTAPPSSSPLCLHPRAPSALLHCSLRPCTSGHWHKGRNCPAQKLLWMRTLIPPCGIEQGLGCIL